MTTRPTWTYDATDDAYRLISGDSRCRVWHSLGNWEAIVSHRLDGVFASSSFATVVAARIWCEERIAEREAERDD